ncbi:hypothetical protein NQZ79_g3927 [Umbelopsis isabellina]|nr:hypothetical protein NQZ79_g3927 [Umbelopsis isabellina]
MADLSSDIDQAKYADHCQLQHCRTCSAEATSQRKRGSEEQTETNGQNEDGPQKRPRLEMTQDGQRRGKRMFGVLMGTLNKFKTDTSTKSSAEKQRAEIDNKLKEKLERERRELAESIARDKEEHIERQQEKKRRSKEEIAQKLAFANAKHRVHLSRYIKTTIEPQLLYRPAKLSEAQAAQIQSQEASAKSELEKVVENQKKVNAESERKGEEKANGTEEQSDTMEAVEESKDESPSEAPPAGHREASVEAQAIDNGEDAMDQRGDASSQNGDIVDYEGEP